MLMPSQVVSPDSHLIVELHSFCSPVREPLLVSAWLTEELHLHLLKLAGAEDEVLCSDLVSEGLTYLGDTEWNLDTGGLEHILVVNIDALGCLRSEIDYGSCIPIGSDMGLEHKVEVSWFCKCSLVSTHWAWSIKVDLVSAET